jgi:F-type H+-transporting ATPase subunit delta
MPKLLPRQYAKILYAITHELKKPDAGVEAFVKFVKRRRALKKMPVIMKEFEGLVREKEGIELVHVTTARPMEAATIAEMTKKLLGCEVEVESNVDSTIIGGLIAQTRTKRIDASVKNQLHQLTNHLTRKK